MNRLRYYNTPPHGAGNGPPTPAKHARMTAAHEYESEAAGERRMTHPLLQTVAGSGDTVSACLLCKAAGVGVLVTNPLATQPNHGGDGEGATRTSTAIHRAGAFQCAVSLGDLTFGLAGVRTKHGVCRLLGYCSTNGGATPHPC